MGKFFLDIYLVEVLGYEVYEGLVLGDNVKFFFKVFVWF